MKDVSLKAQTRDNKGGEVQLKRFSLLAVYFCSPALNSEILEVPNSRSTPHVM